jgi:hypothetical protein
MVSPHFYQVMRHFFPDVPQAISLLTIVKMQAKASSLEPLLKKNFCHGAEHY